MFYVGDVLWLNIYEDEYDVSYNHTGMVRVVRSQGQESFYEIFYVKNGLWHREDGPARIFSNGLPPEWWHCDNYYGIGVDKPYNFPV